MRLFAVVELLAIVAAVVCKPPHVLTPELLVSAPRPGKAIVNDAGTDAIVPVTTAELGSGKMLTDMYHVPLANAKSWEHAAAKRIAANATEGVFLSGHEFAYLKGDSLCLHHLRDSTREDVEVVRFPAPVKYLKPVRTSKTSLTLVFAARVYDDQKLETVTQHDSSEAMQEWSRVMAFDRVMVRHWDEWIYPHRRFQLFATDLSRSNGHWKRTSGFRNLFAGTDQETPVAPLSDDTEFTASPDWVAYATHTHANLAWHTRLDVRLVPLHGGAPKNATVHKRGWAGAPALSPDGETLAFLQQPKDGYESDRKILQTFSIRHGKQTEHLAHWDVSPNTLVFSRDGHALYMLAEQNEQQKAFIASVRTQADGTVSVGEPKEIISTGAVSSLTELPNGDVLYTRSSIRHPSDVYIRRTDGTHIRLTNFLHWSDAHRELDLGPAPEQFSYPGADEVTVHGWLLRPPGYDDAVQAGRKLPLAVLIHGGPEGAWTNAWSSRWNPAAFAAQGYVVVTLDPSGSTGFGQKMTERILGHWGDRPYEDIIKGVHHVLAHEPNVDRERVVAAGASFGGYMINWIQGQDHGIFRALVTHDGVFDTQSAWYATEELYFPEAEFYGPPWQANTKYAQWSPSNHVAKWKTPHLIIHGGQDFRLDPSQGISAFNVLQRRGIPSRLLYFPDEGHWVNNPLNSLRWHHEIFAWFRKHAKAHTERSHPLPTDAAPVAAAPQLVFQ